MSYRLHVRPRHGFCFYRMQKAIILKITFQTPRHMQKLTIANYLIAILDNQRQRVLWPSALALQNSVSHSYQRLQWHCIACIIVRRAVQIITSAEGRGLCMFYPCLVCLFLSVGLFAFWGRP